MGGATATQAPSYMTGNTLNDTAAVAAARAGDQGAMQALKNAGFNLGGFGITDGSGLTPTQQKAQAVTSPSPSPTSAIPPSTVVHGPTHAASIGATGQYDPMTGNFSVNGQQVPVVRRVGGQPYVRAGDVQAAAGQPSAAQRMQQAYDNRGRVAGYGPGEINPRNAVQAMGGPALQIAAGTQAAPTQPTTTAAGPTADYGALLQKLQIMPGQPGGFADANQWAAARAAFITAYQGGNAQAQAAGGAGVINGQPTGDYSTAGVGSIPAGTQTGPGFVAPAATANDTSTTQAGAGGVSSAAAPEVPLAAGNAPAGSVGAPGGLNLSGVDPNIAAAIQALTAYGGQAGAAPPQFSYTQTPIDFTALQQQAYGEVNPGVQAAIQALRDQLPADLQTVVGKMNARGLLDSGINIAAQQSAQSAEQQKETQLLDTEQGDVQKAYDTLVKAAQSQNSTDYANALKQYDTAVSIYNNQQSLGQKSIADALTALQNYEKNQQTAQYQDATLGLNTAKYLSGATGQVVDPTTGQPILDAQGNPVPTFDALKQQFTQAMDNFKALGYTTAQTAAILGIPEGTLTAAVQTANDNRAAADARNIATINAAWSRMVYTQQQDTTRSQASTDAANARANQTQAQTDWRTQYDQFGTTIRAIQQRIQTITDAIGAGAATPQQTALLGSLNKQMAAAQAGQAALGPPPVANLPTAPAGTAPTAPASAPAVPAWASGFSAFGQQVASEVAAEAQAGTLQGPALITAINNGISSGKLSKAEGSKILTQYGLS